MTDADFHMTDERQCALMRHAAMQPGGDGPRS